MRTIGKAQFAVYRTENPPPPYVMAFICPCHGMPSIAWGHDSHGLFSGTCGRGTPNCTVMAS